MGLRNHAIVGKVSTAFKLIGPNYKIVISTFDDPKIPGISCYVARPKTGGIKGGLGLAEDLSIASVSCVQTGAIAFNGEIAGDENGEEVFDESRSLIFKSLQINRLYDASNGSLVDDAGGGGTRIICMPPPGLPYQVDLPLKSGEPDVYIHISSLLKNPSPMA